MRNISSREFYDILRKGLEGKVKFTGRLSVKTNVENFAPFLNYEGEMSLVELLSKDRYTLYFGDSDLSLKVRGVKNITCANLSDNPNISPMHNNSEIVIPIDITPRSVLALSRITGIVY